MCARGKPESSVRAALRLGACVVAAALSGACGAGGPEVLGKETAWSAERSLLIPAAEYVVVGDLDESVVRIGEFNSTAKRQGSAGPRPGLLMPAPGAVQFKLPEGLSARARLFFELGIQRQLQATSGEGTVTFELLLDGELAHSQELTIGRDTPSAERLWVPAEIELGGADTLTLRASVLGADAGTVEVIFATLELREPKEVSRTKSSEEHPNIIVLVVDTLRSDRLEPYGYERPTSPHLVEVASRGVVFERPIAPSSWTPPSTASILTGMDPLKHGLMDTKTAFLSYEDTTIAEICRAAGMRTAAVIANPILSPGHNYWQGFQQCIELYDEPGMNLVEEAKEWIIEQKGSRFFLYLQLFDPHKPYSPMEPHASALSGPAPAGYRPGALVEMMKERYHGADVDLDVLEQYIAHESEKYDAEIAGCDVAIGALFQALEELSLRDETLVVITSDHGEAFGERGRLDHGNYLCDAMLRVPLIFSGPGVPEGERRSDRVELRDVGMTLLELAKVSDAHRLDGRNLFAGAVAEDLRFSSTWIGQLPLPEEQRVEQVGRVFSAESPEWTLIWVPRGDGWEDDHYELYRNSESADTSAEVADEHPELVVSLRDAIADWIERTHRDRDGWSSGEGTVELLKALGYIGDD